LISDTPPIDYWGVDASLSPLVGGHRHKAFRTIGLDQDLVSKTTRRGPASIAWLAAVLSLAQESGLVVPQPIKSGNGHYVEDDWTCEPFIYGEPFQAADISRIGPQVSMFQNVTENIPQRPGFLSARDLLHHDFGGDIDLRAMPPDIVDSCRAAWFRIAEQPICVVHGDLNPSNLIWTMDRRPAVLDWDECRVDAALFDGYQAGLRTDDAARMAVIAWEIACSWQLEPDYAGKLARDELKRTQ
jgi:hypothetical protein